MIANPQRLQNLVRAVALFIAGFIITFTAAYHDTAFSIVLFVATVLAVGLLDLALSRSTKHHRRLAIARAVIAVLAALGLFVSPTIKSFALVVTLWAAVTAVLEVWAGWASTNSSGNRELRWSGIFAGIAAILVLVLPATPVSIIGVFGGYCFVVGTFIGIAAFDPQAPTSQQESSA